MTEGYELINVLHVAILGYWIGSDMVVNAVTHYFKNAHDLTVAQRLKLWDFLLMVDQHPRMALILSVPLGFTLASNLSLTPIQGWGLAGVWLFSIAWFCFIWILRLKSGSESYRILRLIDLSVWWILAGVLFVTGVAAIFGADTFDARWLGAKVACFALVIFCGLAIRRYIGHIYLVLPDFRKNGSTPQFEQAVKQALERATYVLWGLWALLLTIGYLGAAKPF